MGDTRIVCEGDVNLLGEGPKFPENIPSSIVTKPPKPGFVGFGSTYLGHFQEFFSVLRTRRPYRGGNFSTVSPDRCNRAKRGRCPTKSLNDFSQDGGDGWISLESGHQEGGIGVLEMSAYTTKQTRFGSSFSSNFAA
jgi:hypothetical protein